MATKDYIEPSPEQMKAVLDEIASIARSMKELCYEGVDSDKSDCFLIAASNMAAQIGWMADRCLGFGCLGSDGWLLPPTFEADTP